MEELAAEPSLRATGTIVEVDHPKRGKYLTVGNPDQAERQPHRGEALAAARASTPTRCWRSSASAPQDIAALRAEKVI